MVSVEELEKQVKELQKQLKDESEKTSAVEKEVEELKKEVAAVKGETSAPSSKSSKESTKTTQQATSNGVVKESSKKKEESDDSDSEEEAESSEEEKGKEKTKGASGTEPAFSPDKPIIKEGFLEKKGAIRHNWLKRWFELDAKNKYLSYYDKKGDAQPKGVIPLTNATCYAHVEKKGVVKPLFFNIRTETRDFLIRAEIPEDKSEWVKLIKSQCVKGQLSPEGKRHLMKKSSTFIGRTTEEDGGKKN